MNDQMKKTSKFSELTVWKEGHELVLMIYSITANFPQDERYGLISQIQRSAISITANIAEGYGRISPKDKIHFYFISRGSLFELENYLILTKDLGYIENEEIYQKLVAKINLVQKLLSGFITKSKSFI